MKKAKKLSKQIAELEHEKHDEQAQKKMAKAALKEMRKHVPTRRISFVGDGDTKTKILIHDLGFELTDTMAEDVEKEINKA